MQKIFRSLCLAGVATTNLVILQQPTAAALKCKTESDSAYTSFFLLLFLDLDAALLLLRENPANRPESLSWIGWPCLALTTEPATTWLQDYSVDGMSQGLLIFLQHLREFGLVYQRKVGTRYRWYPLPVFQSRCEGPAPPWIKQKKFGNDILSVRSNID